LFFRRYVEDTILGHHRVKLLLLIGHSRWQRRDVPVHVRVALMAAQRHQVDPLGWEYRFQRLSHVMHHVGHSPKQIVIAGHIDDVGARGNDGVPKERRISTEECHDVVVAVDRLMAVVRVPIQIGTNKARPLSGALYMRRKIEFWHHHTLSGDLTFFARASHRDPGTTRRRPASSIAPLTVSSPSG
jgi:hypothetical protein